MAMVPWKKTLPSHRYKKMTIVEVYSREWERELHRKIEWEFFIIPLFNPPNILHCNHPQICSWHLSLYVLSLSHLTFHSTGQVSDLYLIV